MFIGQQSKPVQQLLAAHEDEVGLHDGIEKAR